MAVARRLPVDMWLPSTGRRSRKPKCHTTFHIGAVFALLEMTLGTVLSISAVPPTLNNPSDHAAGHKVTVCTHHKSGSFLAGSVFRRLCGLTYRADRDPERGELEDCNADWSCQLRDVDDAAGVRRTVHFMRNPADLVVSAYFYHRRVSGDEPWLHIPIGSREEGDEDNPILEAIDRTLLHVRSSSGLGLQAERGKLESYQAYLNRVPLRDGLYVSLRVAMLTSVRDMIAIHAARRRLAGRYISTCMSDFTGTAAAFAAKWVEIATFTGYNGGDVSPHDDIVRAVAPHGPGVTKRPRRARHENPLSTEEKNIARQLVLELDASLNHGELATAEALVGCPPEGRQ